MKNVIVLVGEFSSGKSYAGDYLAEKREVPHLGISSSIRTICNERGIPHTREMENSEIQDVGKCLKKCDIFIENNGTLEKFEEELNKVRFS